MTVDDLHRQVPEGIYRDCAGDIYRTCENVDKKSENEKSLCAPLNILDGEKVEIQDQNGDLGKCKADDLECGGNEVVLCDGTRFC